MPEKSGNKSDSPKSSHPKIQVRQFNVYQSSFIQFIKFNWIMSIKQKFSREHKSEKDRENTRRFLTIIAVSTLVLMGLMYMAFVR